MSTDASRSFANLLAIIQRLRAPDGCPWDRQQSPSTLRASLLEEAWECVSAIDARDDGNMEEELGDLYLLVTMMAWMKEQEGRFTVESTLTKIAEKLVRRHPHVFGDSRADNAEQVLTQWDAIKAHEKAGREMEPTPSSALDGVPGALPPLERAAKLQRKAAKVGFDWPGPEPVWDKVQEELAELHAAVRLGDANEVEKEMGDLLFSVVNLSRLLHVDPSTALHRTNGKFARRFREIERRLADKGTTPAAAGLAKMDELWNQAKESELSGGTDAEQSASK